MNPRYSHRWIAWLLPLFVLRVFIPVGFMLSWSADGLQMVICSGITSIGKQATALEVGQHGGQHGRSGEHEHSGAHKSSICPFVVAGSSGAPPSFHANLAFVTMVSHEIRVLPTLNPTSTAVLVDRIRGPPLA
jgi:hypothetical protein